MSSKIALFTVPGEKVGPGARRQFFVCASCFTWHAQDHPATPGLITVSRTRLVLLLLLVSRRESG